MEGESRQQPQSPAKPYVIIIGFGVPGRAVAELLHFSGIDYCVIEKNEATVRRCAKGHEHIISGDATDEAGRGMIIGFTSGHALEGDPEVCCVFIPASPNPTTSTPPWAGSSKPPRGWKSFAGPASIAPRW